MLISEAISDIELRLSKGKPSDDFETDRRQIRHWLDVAYGELLPVWIMKNLEVPVSVLRHYDCQVITTETPTCVTGSCYTRWYFPLPTYTDQDGATKSLQIMSLPDDEGMYRVARQGGGALDRYGSKGKMDILNGTRWGKAYNDYPAWYRMNNKVYIIGDNATNMLIEIDIVLATIVSLSEGDMFPAPALITAEILNKAFQIGAVQLQMPQDLNNDGEQ